MARKPLLDEVAFGLESCELGGGGSNDALSGPGRPGELPVHARYPPPQKGKLFLKIAQPAVRLFFAKDNTNDILQGKKGERGANSGSYGRLDQQPPGDRRRRGLLLLFQKVEPLGRE